MGPEAAEIVALIEEEFSLDLPDSQLAATQTVGDLYQIVLDVLASHADSSCPACKAFHRMRSALSSVLNVPKGSIRHTTRLRPLLPAQTRRTRWAAIAHHLDVRFPDLQPTPRQRAWDRFFLIAVPTALTAGSWLAMRLLHGGSPSGFVLALLAVLLWLLLMLATRMILRRAYNRIALDLPAETAGDLTRLVLMMNFDTFATHADPHEPLAHEAVWSRIVPIVAKHLQLDPHAVQPGTPLQVHQPAKAVAP